MSAQARCLCPDRSITMVSMLIGAAVAASMCVPANAFPHVEDGALTPGPAQFRLLLHEGDAGNAPLPGARIRLEFRDQEPLAAPAPDRDEAEANLKAATAQVTAAEARLAEAKKRYEAGQA